MAEQIRHHLSLHAWAVVSNEHRFWGQMASSVHAKWHRGDRQNMWPRPLATHTPGASGITWRVISEVITTSHPCSSPPSLSSLSFTLFIHLLKGFTRCKMGLCRSSSASEGQEKIMWWAASCPHLQPLDMSGIIFHPSPNWVIQNTDSLVMPCLPACSQIQTMFSLCRATFIHCFFWRSSYQGTSFDVELRSTTTKLWIACNTILMEKAKT